MRTLIGLVLLCITILPGVSYAAETPPQPTGFVNKVDTTDDRDRRYVLYVPHDYTPDKEWPLIVFLHGAGERGDDGLIQTEVGIGTAIRRHSERFPALVLFPQCPKTTWWHSVEDHVDDIITQTRADYNVDAHRIYLTGISMGGYGTWTWGATKADTFAALMPICGGGKPGDLNLYVKGRIPDTYGTLEERVTQLATLPIWNFHGKADRVIPVKKSTTMNKLVEDAGGTVRFTAYVGVGHNSWDKAYAEKDAIAWLLEQRRDTPAPE